VSTSIATAPPEPPNHDGPNYDGPNHDGPNHDGPNHDGPNPGFPKVTAYVTCERGGVIHLLLFRHPLAGIQLPAGSAEDGETPISAAIREVAEETGLHDLTSPTVLGATTVQLRPGARILLRHEFPRHIPERHELPRHELPRHEPSRRSRLNRGLTVELLELDTGQARVRADVLDYQHTPPAVVARVEGWVDIASLGSTVVRHHVHLQHAGCGPDRWTRAADRHVFAPFWVPLVPRPEICDAQTGWLEFAYDRLQRRASAKRFT
jgi:8-oxo-dGTP pyrophosphatase MutT (NUDIX family)